MSRKARVDYPGAYHHIMSRGFKREALFEDDDDYKYYLNCIEEFKGDGYKILEYCLMPNHTHILMRTGEIPLQKILHSINIRYANYKSRKRGLPVPIFQGRPKSIVILGNQYLKVVSRYILRNPVKAGITQNLNEYKWCSYKYLNKIKEPGWYDNQEVLKLFGKNKLNAIKKYKEFVRLPLKADDKEYPLELYEGLAAGSKIIYEKVLKGINKFKRQENKSFTRKIDWAKRIRKIVKENKITIEEVRTCHSKKMIKIKRRIAYIMKVLNHQETYEILSFLGISRPALSRYLKEMKEEIKKGKIKIETI